MPYFPLLSSHRPLPLPLLVLVQLGEKCLMKKALAKRGAEQSPVISLCVFSAVCLLR